MREENHQLLIAVRISLIILIFSIGTFPSSTLAEILSKSEIIAFDDPDMTNKNFPTSDPENIVAKTEKPQDRSASDVLHMRRPVGQPFRSVELIPPITPTKVSIDNQNVSPSQIEVRRSLPKPIPLGGSGNYIYSGSGDWVINTPTTVYDNASITLNGNLMIQNGGNLTLRNVTLIMNCSFDGEYNITVYSGGNLTITGNSNVTAKNPSYQWVLNAKAGSALLLENSIFNWAGWDHFNSGFPNSNGTVSGIRIATNGAQVINCTINNSAIGISLFQAQNSFIASNNITNNGFSGIWLESSNQIVIYNNSIEYSSWGIVLSNSIDNTVSNNTMGFVSYGLEMTGFGNGSIISNNTINGGWDGILFGFAENYTVSGNTVSSVSNSGISLNVSSRLTVSDNLIMNSAGYGIMVQSWNCSVLRNTVTGSGWSGIGMLPGGLEKTDNSVISGNTISSSSLYGLHVQDCRNTSIKKNTITNNFNIGVLFETSSGLNYVSRNSIFSNGVAPAEDKNSTNVFHQNGLGNYWGSAYGGPDADSDGIGDTVHIPYPGISDLYPLMHPIERYWVIEDKQIVENKPITFEGYILIPNGGNLTLLNVTLRMNSSSDGQYRIEVDNGGSLTIEANSTITALNPANQWFLKANTGSSVIFRNSTFSYAGWEYGINGEHAGLWINTEGAQIINCTISQNYVGLYLESSSSSTVSHNTIMNSTEHGIYLNDQTGSCVLWFNVLMANTGGNAYDANGTNQWDNGTHGNWWNDYTGVDADANGIGEQSYAIPGGSGAEDRLPLIQPPGVEFTPPTIFGPQDLTYEAGTLDHKISWYPDDDHPANYVIYQNNSHETGGEWNGSSIILPVDGLAIGVYNFTLIVYDEAGNWASDTVLITVVDTTPPTVTIESPTNRSHAKMTIAILLSGDAAYYWYYIADVDSTNQSWTSSVNRVLSEGTYTLHAFGNDSTGNEGHSLVFFTVDTTAPTVTIASPLNSTYSNSTINLILIGDAAHYWYQLEGPDSQKNASWTTPIQETNLVDGVYTLQAFGNDSAGNQGQKTVTFTVKQNFQVLIEIIDQVTGTNNSFEINDTITLTIDVWDTTTVAIKKMSSGPESSSELESLGIYLDITLSDPTALVELWINVSFAELPEGHEPRDVRIYYYDEDTQTWEEVTETGVDFENEIIWARTNHLTTFGVMKPHIPAIQRDEWLLPLIGVIGLILIVGGIFLVRYTNLKDQMKKLQRRRERREDWQERL
ncbi:MAG: right-handed parallel beta-helix repeat-containing protein [Candidatus Heimdallarchaeota archaeon]